MASLVYAEGEVILTIELRALCDPTGIRTQVTGLKTPCPRPLDDRAKISDFGSHSECRASKGYFIVTDKGILPYQAWGYQFKTALKIL